MLINKVTSSLWTAWIIVMCTDLLGSETSYDKFNVQER
jgi:hypothetical protein